MLKKKKLVVLFVTIVTLITFTSCKNTTDKETEEKQIPKQMIVALLTDELGFGDKGINDEAYQGLKNTSIDNGVEILYKEPKSSSLYKETIDKLVESGGKLIWGAGYSTASAIKDASLEYPEISFITLDNVFDKETMTPNLTGMMIKLEEPAYLAGYIAGMTTKTNKVGFLGGEKGVLSDKSEYGYRAGVFDASEAKKVAIEVLVKYSDSFSDKGKGTIAAKSIYEEGADILFQDAGYAGIGAIDAAKETKKLIIVPEEGQISLAKKNVLIAVTKNYSQIVNELSSRFLGGEEIGGKNYELGFKEKALGISEITEESILDKKVYDSALVKMNEISEGKIKVPFNEETWQKYYKDTEKESDDGK